MEPSPVALSPPHDEQAAAPTLTPIVQQDLNNDPLADVDTSKGERQDFRCEHKLTLHAVIRSRALYSYDAQREEDLGFAENDILLINPAKDHESSWWYGKHERTGAAGWLPKEFVEEIKGNR